MPALIAVVVVATGAAVLLANAEGDPPAPSPEAVAPSVDHAVGWRFAATVTQESPSFFRVTISGRRIDGHQRVGLFRTHLQSIPRSRYPFLPLPKQSDRGQLGPGHPTRSFAFRYANGPPLPKIDRLVFEANAGADPFPLVRFGLPSG